MLISIQITYIVDYDQITFVVLNRICMYLIMLPCVSIFTGVSGFTLHQHLMNTIYMHTYPAT